MNDTRIELTVPATAVGQRLDAFLGSLPEIGTRSQATKLIRAGGVTIDGRAALKSSSLAGGEWIVVEGASPPVARSSDPAVPFEIIFEDQHLLVVDKPAGLVVHPAPGNSVGTLSQALAGRAGGGDDKRPGIVHRLDKATSGLLVVAKSDQVLRQLQAAIKRRDVAREYLALVRGRPQSLSGTIDAPLGRDRRSPKQIAVRDDSLRNAVTHFETVSAAGDFTLIRVRLETGRTHQIRVHLAAIGLPVAGDADYGEAGALGLSRQFLHAHRLAFAHPVTGEALVFESELPIDLQTALEAASQR